MSPSSRGRGLKYIVFTKLSHSFHVALFTRAWIEISAKYPFFVKNSVALFTRAWIEIIICCEVVTPMLVALFTRAWIEIRLNLEEITFKKGRPLHEGVD